MERTVVTVNGKSKQEAIIALEMALEVVREYSEDSEPISEHVCVTNEGVELT